MHCTRGAVVVAARAPVLVWKRTWIELVWTPPCGPYLHRVTMAILGQDGHLQRLQGLCASCGMPGRWLSPHGAHSSPS